jgi:hypothetical protein
MYTHKIYSLETVLGYAKYVSSGHSVKLQNTVFEDT